MKRLMMMGLSVIMMAMTVTACGTVEPGPGQEAVLVMKPFLFGHGGVDPEPVRTGRTIVALTTDAWYVDMVPQQYREHFEDLMSSDGVPLDFDAALRLKVTDSVQLVSKFGFEWYTNNVQAEFTNRVRTAVKKHGMNETAINTTAVEAIDSEVTKAMNAYIKEASLPIFLIDVTVGRANPPDAIKNQRVETAAQEQRANTEKQRKLAEDQRKDAEAARATADNAYRNAMNLSPEQFLRLEAIHMQRDVCAKGGCTFIAGDVTPMMSVGR